MKANEYYLADERFGVENSEAYRANILAAIYELSVN